MSPTTTTSSPPRSPWRSLRNKIRQSSLTKSAKKTTTTLPADPTMHDESSSSFLHDDDFITSSQTTTTTCSRELFDMVTKKRWYFAEKHLERHSQDAHFRDVMTGETVLSMACRHTPPARFIKQLLAVHPQAAQIPSRSGCLALQHACRHNASLDVLKLLVAAHPEAAAATSPTTPVAALWQGRNTTETTGNCATIFWQKMELLLRSIATSRGDDETLLLHAAASLGSQHVPLPVWDYVLSQYASQASRVDRTGRLPLHYAALSNVDMEYSEMGIAEKYTPRQDQVLYRLLQLYPKAARIKDPNQHGQWVLHTAICHGHVWHGGIKELFDEAPEAILIPDPLTGLMPCQLSQDLNTIYRLVRVHPSVMEAQIKSAVYRESSSSRKNGSPRSDKENLEQLLCQSMPDLQQSQDLSSTNSCGNSKLNQSLPFVFEDDADAAVRPTVSIKAARASTKTKPINTLDNFMAKEQSKLKKKKKKKNVKRVTDDDVSLHQEFFVSPEAQSMTGLFYGSLRAGPKPSTKPTKRP